MNGLFSMLENLILSGWSVDIPIREPDGWKVSFCKDGKEIVGFSSTSLQSAISDGIYKVFTRDHHCSTEDVSLKK